MSWSVCLVVFGLVLLLCGLAVCHAARAITEKEISQPEPEPRIVSMNRTPWRDAAPMIVLDARQQAALMQLYREEYVEQCIWPEMPLLSFLRTVEQHQRPDKPIEVEILFAQRHALREFAKGHGLSWLQYAIDRAIERKDQLT